MSADGNANASKKQMLDKGQNTNDDFNQMSDCSSAEMSSTKKETITSSKENTQIMDITSPSTATALSTSSGNIKAENKCASKQQSLYNVSSSPTDSSALSAAQSKFIILGMKLKYLKPCKIILQ